MNMKAQHESAISESLQKCGCSTAQAGQLLSLLQMLLAMGPNLGNAITQILNFLNTLKPKETSGTDVTCGE